MKKFNSFEEYERWTERFENASDYEMIPCAIDDGWKISLDMFTECKSYKTALKRFAKAFDEIEKSAGIETWVEGMKESCENGYFADKLTYWDKEEERRRAKEFGTYAWGVEQIDERLWYVFLNITGAYAGRA